MSTFKTSMTTINIIRESGSSWWRPLACKILLPRVPFMTTWVLAEESRVTTQFHQPDGKPICSNISKRNDLATESNARAISTLRRRLGTLRMEKSGRSLYELEIIMHVVTLNEGTLAHRGVALADLPRPWITTCQLSVSKKLGGSPLGW
jgi:hypothetical protein